MHAMKCQRCNNLTKNPSGLCWLHEGSSSVDNQFSDILLSNPSLLSDTQSDDPEGDIRRLGEMYSQDLPEPGPDRRQAVMERNDLGERAANSLGYPPGFRVTNDGHPFCMRSITDNNRGIAYTFNVEGVDVDTPNPLSSSPTRICTGCGSPRGPYPRQRRGATHPASMTAFRENT